MRRAVTIILSLIFALHISAQSNTGKQLRDIYNEAKHCYLIDDYRQLKECVGKYENLFNLNSYTLGDSAEVYQALLYHMSGAYYYGFSENATCALYSEFYYRQSLEICKKRNIDSDIIVLHEGLFGDFINNCYTKIYEIHSKLKGTKKCNHEKGQIYEFCRAKPAFKSEQDLTIR